MVDAIAWKFQTGSQWIHLPEKYGNWRGVYNRLRMWAIDGTWERSSLRSSHRPTPTTTSTGLVAVQSSARRGEEAGFCPAP
ncbi:hypothetical protein KPP03845_200156 (plasmid) [Streptomyces xanthophaeus]|nr:hypothetical protein KPP03845_200156 [Streptomyces xanthophaeus]